MRRFKEGDLVRRRRDSVNGEYIARVTGHDHGGWAECEVVEVIELGTSTTLKPGRRVCLPESLLTLERPDNDHVWTIREASEKLGREKAEVERQLDAARAHIKRLEAEVARKPSYAGPRSILIELTPPGVEPFDSPSLPLFDYASAELVLAVSVDDSYVKCLKNRYGSQDDVSVKVRWQR